MNKLDLIKKIARLSLMIGGMSFLIMAISKQAKARTDVNQKIVDSIDPEKMQGVFYEIARLPNIFQKEDWIGARDEYELLENGALKVLYKYYEQSFDHVEKVLEARMWREHKDLPSPVVLKDAQTYQNILQSLNLQGYDTRALIRVPQKMINS